MIVICSFNVNRPGAEVEKIKGGVAGAVFWRYFFFLKLILLLQCLPTINSLYPFVTHGRIIEVWDVFREYWSATWSYNQGWEWWHQVHTYLQSRMNCSFLCLVVCLDWEQQLTPTLKWADWLIGQVLGGWRAPRCICGAWGYSTPHNPKPLSPFYLPMSLYGHISNNGS